MAALFALSRALGVSDEHAARRAHGRRRPSPRTRRRAPTHEANGLTITPCSGFPGSSTLEASAHQHQPGPRAARAGPPPRRGMGLRRAGSAAARVRRPGPPPRRGRHGALRRQPPAPARRGGGTGRGAGRRSRRAQRLSQPPAVQRHPSPTTDSPDARSGGYSMTHAGTELEGTGENFSLDALMDVRARTRKAVHLIAEQVKPGMAEDEAKAIARETLKELGMRRGWHHIIVRCGLEHDEGLHGEVRARRGPRRERHLLRRHRTHLRRHRGRRRRHLRLRRSIPITSGPRREVRQIWDDVRDTWFA